MQTNKATIDDDVLDVEQSFFSNKFKSSELKYYIAYYDSEGLVDVVPREVSGKEINFSENLNDEISVGRYHSLSLVETTLPDELEIISKACDDDEIMAVKHKEYAVYGLQFHPESILTPDGLTIIKNFCEAI